MSAQKLDDQSVSIPHAIGKDECESSAESGPSPFVASNQKETPPTEDSVDKLLKQRRSSCPVFVLQPPLKCPICQESTCNCLGASHSPECASGETALNDQISDSAQLIPSMVQEAPFHKQQDQQEISQKPGPDYAHQCWKAESDCESYSISDVDSTATLSRSQSSASLSDVRSLACQSLPILCVEQASIGRMPSFAKANVQSAKLGQEVEMQISEVNLKCSQSAKRLSCSTPTLSTSPDHQNCPDPRMRVSLPAYRHRVNSCIDREKRKSKARSLLGNLLRTSKERYLGHEVTDIHSKIARKKSTRGISMHDSISAKRSSRKKHVEKEVKLNSESQVCKFACTYQIHVCSTRLFYIQA